MLVENEWLKGYRIATISFAGKKTGKCLCVFSRNFQGQGRPLYLPQSNNNPSGNWVQIESPSMLSPFCTQVAVIRQESYVPSIIDSFLGSTFFAVQRSKHIEMTLYLLASKSTQTLGIQLNFLEKPSGSSPRLRFRTQQGPKIFPMVHLASR